MEENNTIMAESTPKGGHPSFYRILEEMADLHSRKNSNYAENNNPLSNLRECEKFGIKATDGTITRMSDKWSRLQQLWNGKEDAVGESIKDTLMDLSIYSILLMILIDEEKHDHRKLMEEKTING